MEEVGAQVAPSILMHQRLSSRLCEAPTMTMTMTMAKKRHLSYQAQSQNHYGGEQQNWNPKLWEWDSVGFVGKPVLDSDSEVLRLGGATASESPNKTTDNINYNYNYNNQKKGNTTTASAVTVGNVEEDGRLDLNLGGGLTAVDVEQPEPPVVTSKPNKRVRSGSPGTAPYPMCQVDNCKEDLSNAKDYHRRHKVCELHSKSTKALVGKQMQRFCQQCSRFHPLSEFDEGKRSCRRRLAGHNRRRRKTQPEDITSRMLIHGHGNQSNNPTANVDIVNLLTALARTQGKTEDRSISCSSVPDREQLLMILSKINSLPLPADLAAKLHNFGSLNRKTPVHTSTDVQNRLNENTSSPSTMDLLAVLSSTLTASSPDTLVAHSQRSSHSSDSEKTKSTCPEQATPNFLKRTTMDFPSVGGERSSTSYQSPVEDSDGQNQETRVNLPLQLFSSSPEDDSPPKLSSSRKYFSSDSSNPIEERSPSSSPVVQTFFPMQSTSETVKSEKLSIGREVNANVEGSQSHGSIMPLELFRGTNKAADNCSFQSFPYQAGYTSSSGSDHSPSSLNSDAQDCTGRIIFKLFDKDPSQFPGTLRKQIYNWLSNSPSEMESYIRPGCVILSLYVSMPYATWEQLEGNLLQRVNSLVQDSDSDFWRNARFLVHTGKQLASHKDGNIRVCKSWRTWSSPELISVSPLAVVGGQELSFKLRGRNLTNLGTKIHCTFMGGYASQEVTSSTCQGSIYDEIILAGLKIQDTSPSVMGRFFIEVENGFKGNSFPVIIADATICKELSLLESEFGAEAKVCDVISEHQAHEYGRPRSREEVLHFLNELGWLFQRKRASSIVKGSDYSLSRFKFLLVFSVDRGCCALVKAILDILVEGNLSMDGLSRESLEMLCEIQLLNRAVKMKCRRMVDLLIHYSLTSSNDTSQKYIFPPNLAGPGGITPLHLAACMSDSDDIIDALTNDPQEIGPSCWNSILDASGHSPYSYAFMKNNHSYNKLVARKLADRRNGQVTIPVGVEIEQSGLTKEQVHGLSSQSKQRGKSCTKCAVAAAKLNKRVRGSQGLLNRPYIHSMLAIAAVCVCVCLFLRGSPDPQATQPSHSLPLDYQYQLHSHSGPLLYPYEHPAPVSSSMPQTPQHSSSFEYFPHPYPYAQAQSSQDHYPFPETTAQLPSGVSTFLDRLGKDRLSSGRVFSSAQPANARDDNLSGQDSFVQDKLSSGRVFSRPHHENVVDNDLSGSDQRVQDRLDSVRVFSSSHSENVRDNSPAYPPLYPSLEEHLGNLHLSSNNNENNYQPSAPAGPPAASVPSSLDSPLTPQGSTLSSPGGFYGYPNDSFSSYPERAYLGMIDSSNHLVYAHSDSFNGQNMQIVPSTKGSLKVLLLHGNLDIWIYSAKNLPNMDMFHKTLGGMFNSQMNTKITSDPYVTIAVALAVVGRTFVISNSEDPVWQQHFYVPVAHCAAEVHFFVKDSDVVGSELIGTVAIPVEQIYSGGKVEGTYPVLNGSGKPCKPGATLTLSIQYTPMERLSFYHRGVGEGPDYIGVPGTYFPLRKGGKVTLYQDAHVPDGCLPHLGLDRGMSYVHGKCWYDICNAISQAQRLIYITGWSVWHKVKLVRDASPALDCTLGELLRSKSQEGVRVLLLVWDDPTSRSILGYKMDGVMQTHDEETRRVFKHSSVKVLLCPRIAGKRHSWAKQKEVGTIYTHHQKTVIVDADAGYNRRKIIAFVGGLDLCDGRYDNPHHPLFRTLQTLHKDDYHNPTFTGNTTGCPREPWHDLHSKIDGPAAYDVLTNFEERWRKASKPHGIKKLKSGDDALLRIERIPGIIGISDAPVRENDAESWHVQIFRSIDSTSVRGFPKDPKEATSKNLVCGKNVLIDMSIHTAYVKAIRSAQHFIYIENQYFIGSSYNWSSYKDLGANNLIPMEIALKIADKIRAHERFAAYIVIPMWPEGVPTGAATQRILFWQHKTMQMMYETIYKALVEVGLEGAFSPQDYLNFFCLGNREVIDQTDTSLSGNPTAPNTPEALSRKSGRFMIYVHSKGMIVDDEYVILGSANINQRSMEGTRDTEIAMGAYQPEYTWARMKRHPYGQIYGYRMSLWAEHLGYIEDCFGQPETLECVRKVRSVGENNWQQFAADDQSEMRSHLIKYPVEVDRKGKVRPIPGYETFPDVGGNIVGSFFAIQENLTI